jgi:hypothetical protein
MSGHAAPSALQPGVHPDGMLARITVDWDLGFKRAPTKLVLAYWRSLCGGRAMPQRREINPRPIRSFLRHVNLIDIRTEAAGRVDYIVSLQGQHAQEVFGPIAHRNIGDSLPAQIAQRWRYCFDIACNAGCPVRVASSIAAGSKLWLDSESLLAPLGQGTDIDTLLLVFDSWPVPPDRVAPLGI